MPFKGIFYFNAFPKHARKHSNKQDLRLECIVLNIKPKFNLQGLKKKLYKPQCDLKYDTAISDFMINWQKQ